MATHKTYRYRNILSTKLVLFFLLLLLCAQALGATEGRCIRVSDGDTITIDAGGGKEKVRLIGIDAPELRQEGGPEARQYLAKRILNRRVKVEGETRDRYGRLLGTVYLGEENINLSLVREGHAWDYKAYSAGPAYTCAEQTARAARRGLWAQKDAVAPWHYRQAERRTHAKHPASSAPRPEAATALYWVSNSGKTHNRRCRHFRDNPGSGSYTNTPSPRDAKCCGGAGRSRPRR